MRHAVHGHLGAILSGRTEGVPLSVEGVQQAQHLAFGLAREPLAAIATSPVQRARETAAEIARESSQEPVLAEALHEINFGTWTGRRFEELEGDPAWTLWNSRRSEAMPPGGESMAAAQQRAIAYVRRMARAHPGETVALVTHCDIIRAVVAAVLGLSLDNILRFDIDPASVTRIAAGEWGERLVSLNEQMA